MESWGGGYVDSFTRATSNPLVNWELRAPPSFLATDSAFTSTQQVSSGHVPDVSGLGDSTGEQVIGDLIADVMPCRIGRGRDVDGLFLGEEVNMFSKFSGSLVDQTQSPMIDLKLGSFADQGDGPCSGLPQSVPSRRCRAAGVSNQVAYCQVYCCNKDLSKSKDYHKRHKVCEVHSKTPTVIVGGIEQRFCQQCSRFHLLREFDDGKRSCRKRLAGHNERRRKPQVGFHSSGRAGRFFLPYDVGKFHGMNDWLGNIKLEAGAHYSPLPSVSFLSRDVHPRVPFSSPSYEKGNKESSTTVNMFGNISLYSGPRPLLNRYPSLGSEDFDSVFNAESPIQGLSGISEPGCALSLLSAQSRDSSSHTSGIPTEQSLSQYSITQFSDNLVVNSGSSKFPNPAEGSQACPGVVYDGRSSGFEVPDNTLCTREFSNRKDRPLSPTINLLQLSSELQRVEHEKQYMKLENEFVCL